MGFNLAFKGLNKITNILEISKITKTLQNKITEQKLLFRHLKVAGCDGVDQIKMALLMIH